ncbi:hypothetical protein PILCRDRAFT_810820 [Piloderma croceum F 1598]|uniref:Uncharacterized protein n=1 Tax=Piloderma croceum (strain F 1598) TaxID=765440 RepID=A0A0C3BYA5_PILCF|nr:hypothetical protein PILCRDRAFT_810820 [Piloderma croceum F 1598]
MALGVLVLEIRTSGLTARAFGFASLIGRQQRITRLGRGKENLGKSMLGTSGRAVGVIPAWN